MDLISNLALGFSTALTFANLAYAFAGVVIGTLIGVLPGIGPIATLAMLLPTTYALEPTSALIMLAGIYYGAQYGGSTTAILVNLPGESSSVVTCIDGYQMARRGRAGAALATAALGSFFAGTVGTLILAALAGPMVELAFKFGPAEYFSLMVLGLIGAVVLASGSLVKAIAMIVLGLLLGLVGTDVNSGVARFSFDVPELADGIGFVGVAMGVFGFAEIIANLEQKGERQVFTDKVGKLLPNREEFLYSIPARAARHGAGLAPRRTAGRRCAAGFLCSLYGRKEDHAQPEDSVRSGQHPRRCSAGVGQQRRRTDLVHPDADTGHPAECRHGADGGRNDDPQYPAGTASHDQ